MREIWKIMFGIAGEIVFARACVAVVFGVCYVELAFGEQDFNEEIKLGRDGRAERTGLRLFRRALL